MDTDIRVAPDYHTLPVEDLYTLLGTTSHGLSSEEAKVHLETSGPNDVAHVRKQPLIIQFLEHFKNLLVIILLIAAIISLFVGEVTDAAIIIVIIILSVTLDFFQEYKAGNAAEMLRKKLITRTSVFRDGVQQEIAISDLVPGDLVSIAAGDIVPADARVISARNFFVNQSALTGEPFPIEKTETLADQGKPINEADNYIFLGTSVVSGTATAIITRTGTATEFGKIARSLVERPPETEFERGLKHFSYLMSKIIFFLVIFVFLINALYKHGVLDSLLFAVALAVGMTPELLPMILSLNLSKGAIAMSEKGAIVKHPESIQNFGSMDVLCTDKTGTLTDNKIALIRHLDTEGKDNDEVLLYSFINSAFHTSLKSPLDKAVVAYKTIDISGYHKIDEIPFDFLRKRLSIVTSTGNERILISKGAPEEIFRICTTVKNNGEVRPLTDESRENINNLYQDMSKEGFRALAVCYRPVSEEGPRFSIRTNMI